MPFIEINKKNFFNNLDIIAQKTKSKDKIALVLKDNAYGHGLELIAQLAYEYGLKRAVVQYETEALKIADKFSYILILSDQPKKPQPHFHYTVNSLYDLSSFPNQTNIELKIDTGMHRNGILPDQLNEAFAVILKRSLKLKGVFTHHRSADELTSEWFWQNKQFENLKYKVDQLLKEHNLEPVLFHKDNSASLFRLNAFNEDLARIGIAAYGTLEMPLPFKSHNSLQPVLSLYAKKISTKKLPKGSRIGYGGKGVLSEESTVSTYDIGYGDGFFRSLSHNYTTPKGIKLIGRISMDNSSFISSKEDILIFNDANEVAKEIGTIGYEVLTSLKQNIPRKIIE